MAPWLAGALSKAGQRGREAGTGRPQLSNRGQPGGSQLTAHLAPGATAASWPVGWGSRCVCGLRAKALKGPKAWSALSFAPGASQPGFGPLGPCGHICRLPSRPDGADRVTLLLLGPTPPAQLMECGAG